MFNPKRIIPRLAVAALALTGCAETDGDLGGNAGSGGSGGTLADSLTAFCMKLVECFPNDYDNTGACVEYLTIGYELDGDITAGCEAAAVSYFQCGAALSCMQLEDPIATGCDDEFDAAADACGQ